MDATFRFNRRIVLAILACFLLTFLPTLSAAQEPVQSFDQLNTRLKVGDTVWVTDAEGREVKGNIRSVDAASLSLDGAAGPTFRAGDALTIDERRPDPLKNGTLIGLVVGLGAGLALVAGICANGDCQGSPVGASLFYAGIGAGIGAGVDAAIPGRRQIVYRAGMVTPSARLSLAPVITPRTKAVAVTYSF